MAALSLSSVTGAAVTDGTRQMTPIGILGADGSYFVPAMDAATRPGYQRLCDGTNSVTLVDSANVPVAPRASASGGATPYSLIVAASNNATVVKASAGTLYTVHVSSVVADERYLKIYDKSTTPSDADTPVLRVVIPGSTAGSGFSIDLPSCGVVLANGISFRLVTDQADNGTTNPGAGDCVLNLIYK